MALWLRIARVATVAVIATVSAITCFGNRYLKSFQFADSLSMSVGKAITDAIVITEKSIDEPPLQQQEDEEASTAATTLTGDHVKEALALVAVENITTSGDMSAIGRSIVEDKDEITFIPSRDCPSVRGIHGVWEEDEKWFHEHIDYIPFSGFRARMAKRQHKPYRAGWYRWRETKYPECQLKYYNLTSWCSMMKDMDMSRIFFLGDSLAWGQAIAFLGVIHGRDPFDKGPAHGGFANRIYHCSGSPFNPSGEHGGRGGTTPGFDFRLLYERQNLAPTYNVTPTNVTELEFNHEAGGCANGLPVSSLNNSMCPWTRRWFSDDTPTILIANGGAHYHSERTFQEMFDGFLDTVDRSNRTQDIIFFRTTAPGHFNCWEHGEPYQNYSEYEASLQNKTDKYDWLLMDRYNEYARITLRKRREQHPEKIPIHLLDIYNMTALRPDGHVCGPKGDCLHYESPGSHDGWNHLLYSNLVDFAAEKKRTAVESDR